MPDDTRERRAVYPGPEPAIGARTGTALPRESSRKRSGWGLAETAVVALSTALFLLQSYLPLRATDLWQHVTYGNWILEHRELPAEDPVMPLSAGIEVVDTEWLSQVVFAAVDRSLGPEGLSALFALVTLACYLLLGRTFFLQTKRLGVAAAAAVLALVVGFSRLMTIRPENFGALCFAALLWLLVSSGAANEEDRPLRSLRLWFGVPLVFLLWANFHGSFPAGWIVLGCFLAGRGLERLRTTRSLRGVLEDRPFRRWLVVTELAVAASLVNPYGAGLVVDILAFSGNANLRDIVEWYSLDLAAWGGREFFASWVLVAMVFRHSRLRVPVAHALLIGVFAVMVVHGNRFLTWYAPALAFALAPHLAELAARWRDRWGDRSLVPAAFSRWQRRAVTSRVWIAASVFLAWAAFALSPISRPVLGGPTRSPEALFGDQSPVELAEHLRKEPPDGLVYVPQIWSDYLVRFGPEELQPMVTSMIHLIPHQVWRDYLGVHNSVAGWVRVTDLYSIDTVILERAKHTPQIGLLTRSLDWRLAYEDEQGAVFEKRVAGSDQQAAAAEVGGADGAAPGGVE